MAELNLVALRRDFLQDVYVLTPDLPRVWTSLDELLLALVHCRDFDLTQRLAKYTFEVFAVYASCEIFKPAEYLYQAME
jgi:hypothetical protein